MSLDGPDFDYPLLPGPSRFISNVTLDLSRGKTTVVVFPESTVEKGIADSILHEIGDRDGHAEYCMTSADPFPTRVLHTYGADPIRSRAYDDWESIIRWEPWHRSQLIIRGWEHSDTSEVIARWPAQLHSSGLAAEDRPKLIIGARLCDLDRVTLTKLSGEVGVHWWWGAMTRLDTETRLAAFNDRNLNALDAAVIVELAGWDLDAVDFLATRWDRTTLGLDAAVADYRAACSSLRLDPPPRTRRTSLPPVGLEQDWRDGSVDRWSQSIRRSPAGLDRKGITQLVWFAHNRVLMPHIDEEREHFERLIVAKATNSQLADLRRRADDFIEIGSLAWLVETGRVSLGREDRDRLRVFRDLRNTLAHRMPVQDELRLTVMNYLDLNY